MSDPKVSVVVAVYNRADLLKRCLDSLVYQTLNEIEIIVIDDQSTDSSFKVANEYSKLFPDKVFVYYNPEKGVANAKNLGIKNARGNYITFCDSDDYVEYWAYEKMYQRAVETKAKIVCAPIYKDQGKSSVIAGKDLVNLSLEEIFSKQTHYNMGFLPTKLFHKSVFEEYGNIPVFNRGEDIAFIYSVMSTDIEFAWIEQPYYHYELSDNSICRINNDINIVRDLFCVNKYILENVASKYYELFRAVIIYRAVTSIGTFPNFEDLIISEIKKQNHIYKTNSYLEQYFPQIDNKLQKILELDNNIIPNIIHINAYGKVVTEQFVSSVTEKAFRDGCDIKLITETLQPLSEYPFLLNAYKKQNYQYIGEYFALKNLFLFGGIYLDCEMILQASLDRFAYNQSFWVYEDDETISDCIFGAQKENEIIKKILESYMMPELYDEEFPSLKQRIRTALVLEAGVPFGKTIKFESLQKNAVIYPPQLLFCHMPMYDNVCFKLFTDSEKKENNIYEFSKSTLESVLRSEINLLKGKINKQQGEINRLQYWNNRRISYIKKVEEEISAMKQSKSWKITAPLRGLVSSIKKSRHNK